MHIIKNSLVNESERLEYTLYVLSLRGLFSIIFISLFSWFSCLLFLTFSFSLCFYFCLTLSQYSFLSFWLLSFFWFSWFFWFYFISPYYSLSYFFLMHSFFLFISHSFLSFSIFYLFSLSLCPCPFSLLYIPPDTLSLSHIHCLYFWLHATLSIKYRLSMWFSNHLPNVTSLFTLSMHIYNLKYHKLYHWVFGIHYITLLYKLLGCIYTFLIN